MGDLALRCHDLPKKVQKVVHYLLSGSCLPFFARGVDGLHNKARSEWSLVSGMSEQKEYVV